jgi:tRNA pseudouridine38-40 synthase
VRNIKLTIAYDGTAYKGWQVQKNERTVQEELEKAISALFGGKHTLYGASRTDAGVHALAQVANFKTTSKIPVSKIPFALNAVVPEDIVVKKAEEAEPDFHSRFAASSKIYRYDIFNSKSRDPFRERYSCRVPYVLDVPLMLKEAAFLKGRHDFRSFQASDKRERSSVRTIRSIGVKKKGRTITIHVEGDGFLYNMVRNIAGTLIDTGRGYLAPGSVPRILKAADRTKAGPTAPAKGLFLIRVKY